MAGRDVHAAGAGIHRDEVRREHNRGPRQKRMLRADAFQLRARKGLRWLADGLPTRRRAEFLHQQLRENEHLRHAALREPAEDVLLLRMDGEREIRRQRPGRGCPGDEARLLL